MKNVKITGLAGSALLLMMGCGGEEPAEGTPTPTAEAAAPESAARADLLDKAFMAGRLAGLPMGASVRTVAANSHSTDVYSRALAGDKDGGAWLRPTTSAEEQGARQLDLSNMVEPSAGLEITLSLAKGEFALGEPVWVRATMTNTSDRALQAAPLMDPLFTYGNVVVTAPDGETLGLSPVAIACSRGDLQVETLEPGESVTQDFPIFYGRDGFLFSEPGVYTVQLLYRGITEDAGRVDSDPVHLMVRGDEAGAAELAMSPEAGLFMMWGEGDHLEQGIADLQELIAAYPGSTLAAHARYALGRNLSVDFMDGTRRALREARPLEARGFLEPLVADLRSGAVVMGPAQVREAFSHLATARAAAGDRDGARALLSDLLVEFGGQLNAEDALKVREQLARL